MPGKTSELMIHLHINGVHTKLTKKEEAYAKKKIGALERYVPKKARDGLKVDVKIKASKARDKTDYTCEVLMRLPHDSIAIHEKSTTILAAIDLAEANLKIRIKKYKEKHAGPRVHRKIIDRFKRSSV